MTVDRDSLLYTDLDAPETPRTAMRRRDIRRRAARRRNRVAAVIVAPVALTGAFYVGYSVLGDAGDHGAAQIVSSPLTPKAKGTDGPTPDAATVAGSGPSTGPETSSRRPATADASRTVVRAPAPAAAKARPTTKDADPDAPSTGPSAAPTTNKPPATKTAQSKPAKGATSSNVETEVLRLVNVEREKANCKPVKADAVLTAVARAHSKDMAVKGYFSHDAPDGKDPFERMTAAGYKFSWAAENIAAGQTDPADVMESWMNSEGHRANILNCKLTELGVGMWKQEGSQYGIYWTQSFGTPR